MTIKEIIKKLRDMAKYPTVTLPRDCEALKAAADLLSEQEQGEPSRREQKQFMDEDVFYTTPQQRKPLTDEQMWNLWNSQGSDDMTQKEAIAFARAIEAAHGIKE